MSSKHSALHLFRRAAAAFLFVAAAAATPAKSQADSQEQSPAAVRALAARVATIGHRLATASLDLCEDEVWLPGLTLHDLAQYGADDRSAAIRVLGLDAGPGVFALAADGPAERAGLRPDDIILGIDGEAPPQGPLPREASFDRMELILALLDRSLADGAAAIEIRRGGARQSFLIDADRGCATRFQLIGSRGFNALADGRYVQVTVALAAYLTDDGELAAVLAHELAHNILHHRARLDAAGVQRGLLSNFGRNARLFRETESEADRLSVYLLERAGYDPEAAVRYREQAGRRSLNAFWSPTHGHWRTRAAELRAEIARIRLARTQGEAPMPAFLDRAAPAR